MTFQIAIITTGVFVVLAAWRLVSKMDRVVDFMIHYQVDEEDFDPPHEIEDIK